MKLNKILFGTFMIATVGLMCACSSDDDNGGGGNTPQEREKEVKGEMKKAELLGFVKDTNGNPLAGVKVGSGTTVTTTDASGAFALTNIEVVKGRTVVDFTKEGYFDIVRSYNEASKDKWEVVMVSKANNTISTNATYNASSAKTLKTNAGMEVKMPADGYKNAETGKDYTGTVKSEMLYLNPDDDNFATMMPGGDLAAVDASNQNVQLISYGMTKVEMTDNAGNKLQLKDGKEAQLTFPIPESLKANTPAQIPLWSFNESTGLWEEEGMATLQNGVYVGTVKHFSWVNLDWPEKRVTCIITVKTSKGKLVPWTVVHVGQTTCMTNSQGVAQCYIPENTDVDMWINPEDCGGYKMTPVNVKGQAGGTTINQTIILKEVSFIRGKIVNQDGSNLATVWVEYNGNETKYYITDFDGKFEILAPSGYTGPATLKIRAANGELYTKKFEIVSGVDTELGDIEVNAKTDPQTDNIVYVNTDDKKTYQLPLTFTRNSPLNGATLVDNYLEIYNEGRGEGGYDEQWIDWAISSEQYDRAKGTAIGEFFYMIEGSNSGRIQADVEQANMEVKISGKQVIINMSGRGTYFSMDIDENFDEDKPNAAFTGTGLKFNIIVTGETKKPFTKAYAPSFMPFPSEGQYPIGAVYTGAVFKSAVEAYCDGDASTYNQLVAAADASCKGWGKKEVYNGVAYYTAEGGNYLEINYDPYEKWNEAEVEAATSAYAVWDTPIVVYAAEGLTVDPSVINDELENQYYKSPRRAIAKTKSKLSPFYRKK
ncbi:MAG: carboxypeptidase regulatory-like domain-containing protein [Bacteroidaceae bacterium]|nr:carboxypeptidase regulatory-like domain-containing protein [Bacteroidaceae bacterium]